MQLVSGSNVVSLTPVRYEFPDMQPSGDKEWDYDRNWLIIHGEVRDGDLSWSFTEPCLTTREARQLGEWLRQVHRTGKPEGDLDLVEANLSFDWLGGPDAEGQLVISFAQESSPRAPTRRYGTASGTR